MWYRVILLAVVTSLLAVSTAPREGTAQDRAQLRRELNQVRQGLNQIRRDMTPLSQLITDLSGGLRQALSSVNFAISSIELAIPLDPDNSERQLLLAQARRSILRALAVSQCLAQGSASSCRALLNLPFARIQEIEQRCKLKLDEVGLINLIQCLTEDIRARLDEAKEGLNAICDQVSDSELCNKIVEKINDISSKLEDMELKDEDMKSVIGKLEEALEEENPEDALRAVESARDTLQDARNLERQIYLNIGQAVQLLRGALQLLVKLKPRPSQAE